VLDVDELVADLQVASRESQPMLAARDVLDRALCDPGSVQQALPATRAELTPLHRSDELTVLKVVWAPHMWIQPHDHRMWAVIGIYGGQEDNTFFRRERDDPAHVARSGAKQLATGDIGVLGDDAIHSVENPLAVCTGAIHVYGGDFFARERSDWTRETLEPTTPPPDDWFEQWNRPGGAGHAAPLR
jgi:predicted metal-dependent enzyme (double-stranded beta helix superfamily)